MAVDDREFRTAMSHFASGVTVVTTEHEGRRYGMTVASFASLSLRPPLVLVCIEKGVQTHDAILESRHFAVSILRSDQGEVSNRFAMKGEDKFAGVDTRVGVLGDPLLVDALATVECRLAEAVEGGDHTIFIGSVEQTSVDTESAPLLYFRSQYNAL